MKKNPKDSYSEDTRKRECSKSKEKKDEAKKKWLVNVPNEGDGLELLKSIEKESVQLVIFDPQYESVNDATVQHKQFGDNAFFYEYPISKQSDKQIKEFCEEIKRILKPNGYCCLWINKKIMIGSSYLGWFSEGMRIKEILIWHKKTLGIGWGKFRNQAEYCLLWQKWPYVADSGGKGIGNIFSEFLRTNGRAHVHRKPYKMTRKLIKQLTKTGDLVVDPCAGSFIVLVACQKLKRNFLGSDLTLSEVMRFNINKENSRALLNKERSITAEREQKERQFLPERTERAKSDKK